MTIDEILQVIDDLSPEEQARISQHIAARQQEALRKDIEALLADARPEVLQAGTMNVDKLREAVTVLWDGLSDDEIDKMTRAMQGDSDDE